MQISIREESPVFPKQTERFRRVPAQRKELLLFRQPRIHLLDQFDADQHRH
jgi:hypothetical protein